MAALRASSGPLHTSVERWLRSRCMNCSIGAQCCLHAIALRRGGTSLCSCVAVGGGSGLRRSGKVLAQTHPALIVVTVDACGADRLGGRPRSHVRLEHERERALNLGRRLGLFADRCLVRLCVRPVRRHAQVQRRATRRKAVLLCLIHTLDEAHELVLNVAVIVGRPESILGRVDAWWKNDKVCDCAACAEQEGRHADGVWEGNGAEGVGGVPQSACIEAGFRV
mmetsp:Transcript_2808/g.7563  ORF Transcript_2808/g.7563 Transcript_2808/m.7563 type:complete len:224 (+) Transcript_2808:320-991(+)